MGGLELQLEASLGKASRGSALTTLAGRWVRGPRQRAPSLRQQQRPGESKGNGSEAGGSEALLPPGLLPVMYKTREASERLAFSLRAAQKNPEQHKQSFPFSVWHRTKLGFGRPREPRELPPRRGGREIPPALLWRPLFLSRGSPVIYWGYFPRALGQRSIFSGCPKVPKFSSPQRAVEIYILPAILFCVASFSAPPPGRRTAL
ncbi:hypothetical protein ISCGN_013466 [Ixodes scapularis]